MHNLFPAIPSCPDFFITAIWKHPSFSENIMSVKSIHSLFKAIIQFFEQLMNVYLML